MTMHRRGVTILELLITIAVATGVMTLATYFALDVNFFGTLLGSRLDSERGVERTLRTFISEARSMSISENGSYPIAAAAANGITFYADVDADGTFEQIRYFLDGTTIRKGVTEPTGNPATYPAVDEQVRDVITSVVPGPDIFAYWEGLSWTGNTASLSAPVPVAQIRLIRMRVTVDDDPTLPPAGFTQSIDATIRNLRGEI
ncbi:MAG TPA: hypothetical protein VD862_04505 [Candidatus Paceibacterota bacterium]|nr:hypothetical protein [Candidatus Paceibacterota bacterium]